MTTITEFILARVAEDEATARYATTRGPINERDTEGWWFGHYQHYTRHSPERVLAECEAKRRIAALVWTQEFVVDGEWGSGRTIEEMKRAGILPPALCAMAAIWADHPDYREEWR